MGGWEGVLEGGFGRVIVRHVVTSRFPLKVSSSWNSCSNSVDGDVVTCGGNTQRYLGK